MEAAPNFTGQATDYWGRGKSRVTGRSAAGAGSKRRSTIYGWRSSLALSPRKAVSATQVRQSDLASYSRCPQQKKLVDQHKADAGGKQPEQLSMTAYGSVMHHAIHVLEKLNFDKRPDALEKAHATFDFYWDPANITAICDAVTIWAARQTWAGLARKGHQTIDLYAKYLQADVSKLLGLELEFNLPFELDGEQHTLHGTMDRLSLRKLSGQPYLNIEDFKGLALDTPLPTSTGWTTMGAVQVGDQVIGSDGRPTTVVVKSGVHSKPCFRMTFDDGSSVVCDEDHLWKTVSGQRGENEAVRDVLTLRRDLFSKGVKPQRHQRVLNAQALDLPEADLPVHPYVYGAWLGDGRKKRGEISKPDDELFDRIASFGYSVGPDIGGVRSRASTVYGLGAVLRNANLLGHRAIPEAYLRASYEQRLWLLRGLMDTDGSWHKKRQRAVFTTCDKGLGETVRELVVSLGWKASVFQVVRTGFGLTVDAWDVCFTPTDVNPFSLSRKADLVRLAANAQAGRRLIVSIESVVTVPTQCIQVDAPDSMYLCGEAMIPTHNTGKDYGTRKGDLRWNVQFTLYSFATTQEKFWTDAWGQEEGTELFTRFSVLARRGTWISLKNGVDHQDAGWRGPQDYARGWAAVRGYVKAVKADIYPLSLTGDVCFFCAFREGICGGVAVPDEDYGRPEPRPVKA